MTEQDDDWEDMTSGPADAASSAGPSTPTRPVRRRAADSESAISATSSSPSAKPRASGSSRVPTPRRRAPASRKPQLPAPVSVSAPSPRPKRPPESLTPNTRENPTSTSSGDVKKALSLLLTTLRIAWSVFDWLITPFKAYILLFIFTATLLYLTYCVLIYYALPRLPSFLLKAIGILFRPLDTGWILCAPSSLVRSFNLTLPSDVDVARGLSALALPIGGLATTSCTLLGMGCDKSLLSTDDRIAQPFWRRERKSGVKEIDDAQIAWALTQESRSAKTIFDSVSTLGSRADVFEHIEIWKHGVAVSVESKLDSKNVLGTQLFQLGDLSKDLHDEIRRIDSLTVTTFGNLHLEFADLTVQLLDQAHETRSATTLARRFDNTLQRLGPNLDDLILRVTRAADLAQEAVDQGKQIAYSLRTVKVELEEESSQIPIWQRGVDSVNHMIRGGETPRSKIIRRDLRLVEGVVQDVDKLWRHLETARQGLLDYRSQTAGFQASLYGVHLAANGTLELEDELRILGPLMEEFGNSLDEAKTRRLGGGGAREVRKAKLLSLDE